MDCDHTEQKKLKPAYGRIGPCLGYIHCVSKKNDNDVAHYNFNTHKPILVIFCTDVAE